MNSKSLRRLAADHGSLHTAGLPPNYLFPPGSDDTSDLTSLDILLAGPVGTPYASGVWRLHLDIPPTYPTAPPTAQFRTRLWHPNIDEATGAVCVETLKRDWSSTLKLRDVLVTISCLLIQPNPASALNEAAGKLATEDWEGYCRRARLMTDIHAAIPRDIEKDVREAQMRGEDKTTEPEQTIAKPQSKGKETEKVKITPSGPKLTRMKSEDEENRSRRGGTQDAESGTEEDAVTGQRGGDRTRRSKVPESRRQGNIFGIKGLGDGMQIDSPPPKRIFAVPGSTPPVSTPNGKENGDGSGDGDGEGDDAETFTTVTSKRNTHPDSSNAIEGTAAATQPDTETPDLLKFSTQNPFAAIQPNNQTHPLFREFSFSWEDAMVLHEGGIGGGVGSAGLGGKGGESGKSGSGGVSGVSKADVRKRHATEAFEKKERWEMKRFKRAGGDLKRFNRGDWGVRMGVGRL